MASSSSGLFCGAFDCSNNKSVQKARDFFRFPKEAMINKLSRPYCSNPRQGLIIFCCLAFPRAMIYFVGLGLRVREIIVIGVRDSSTVMPSDIVLGL